MTVDLTDRQRPWIPLTIMITSSIIKQTCEPKTVQYSTHRYWLSIETIEIIIIQPYCWPLFPTIQLETMAGIVQQSKNTKF